MFAGNFNPNNFLYHEPCPACRKSGGDFKGNNLARYDDGHGYCFSCGFYEKGGTGVQMEKEYKRLDLIEGEVRELNKRGLTEKTCAFFNYRVGRMNGEVVQIASYYDRDNKLSAQHIRFANKDFKWLGDYKSCGLFGMQLWRGVAGKRLIITEGELDAMTISQLQENKFPVVSIRSGANGAVKDIKENLEWVESFDTVIFAFDMDEPGRHAANECALLLTPSKARIAWLPAKDANECLQKGLVKELINALWEAKPYRPDGIITGAEIKALCETAPSAGLSIPYPILDEKILGIRPGELLLFTAGSGIGKTTLVHEIAYHLHQEHKISVGLICLEESVGKTGRRWVGMRLNKNITMPDVECSKADFDNAFAETVGRGDWYAYNHFGSTDISTLISKIRYMAVGLGVRIIMLDHISIVVSGLDEAGAADERKLIDVFMTRLRSLVEETGVTVLAIVHLKRPDKGKSWNEGRQVTLTDLRGSGGLEQLSDIVISLERDQQSEQSNISTIRILKNRVTGVCGQAGNVKYDRLTGRLEATIVENAEDFGFGEVNGEDEF